MEAMGKMASRVRPGGLPWGVVALLAALLVLFAALLAYRDATKARPFNIEALQEPWNPGTSGQGASQAVERAADPSDRNGVPGDAAPSGAQRPHGDEASDGDSAQGAGPSQPPPAGGAPAGEDTEPGDSRESSAAPTPAPLENQTPDPPSGSSPDTGARERAIKEGRKADVEAWDRAVECARAKLRVPESAAFAEFGDSGTSVTWSGETATVEGYVEARTGTGRSSRSRFRTILHQKEGFLWERETVFDETR